MKVVEEDMTGNCSREDSDKLYKTPEANAARSKDRNKHHVEFCIQLFNNGMHVELTEDAINVF